MPCRCGSVTHQRTNHSDCPLNPRRLPANSTGNPVRRPRPRPPPPSPPPNPESRGNGPPADPPRRIYRVDRPRPRPPPPPAPPVGSLDDEEDSSDEETFRQRQRNIIRRQNNSLPGRLPIPPRAAARPPDDSSDDEMTGIRLASLQAEGVGGERTDTISRDIYSQILNATADLANLDLRTRPPPGANIVQHLRQDLARARRDIEHERTLRNMMQQRLVLEVMGRSMDDVSNVARSPPEEIKTPLQELMMDLDEHKEDIPEGLYLKWCDGLQKLYNRAS